MFAQALVESGALNSLGASVQETSTSVQHWLGTITPAEWGIGAAVVFLVLVIWSRRRASRYLD
jgi:hypothetical protein